MVRVPAGSPEIGGFPTVKLEEFWIDKFEVTNRAFKEFVDRGGYRTREPWKHPLIKDGRALSWVAAMAEFHDPTGRPGPATWELGTYPDGKGDHPVGGVSWHEAAAYCDSVGKSLPTVYHWYDAAGSRTFSDILRLSNFGGKGPDPVGSHAGLGRYGTYDMAGNVKEWAWNAVGNHRYILGGAWSDPSYMFTEGDAQPPFDRLATYGFRCVQYPALPSGDLVAEVPGIYRDYSAERPVGDDVFEFYRSVYSYDRTQLNEKVESVDTTPEHWRVEKVSFDAAYGSERVMAYLYLPKGVRPPYQTVVHFPGSYALHLKSSEHLTDDWFVAFVIRGGRALLFPIYKGTYARQVTPRPPWSPGFRRDIVIQWSKDLGRSIDYLETRPDVDRDKLAYQGFSLGAAYGPILTAIEGRFKASLLLCGGFYSRQDPPEIDAINFAPRARAPVLMLNGRHDFHMSLEHAQLPVFHLLGAPDKDKRHVLFDSGHALPRDPAVMKEMLDWLDHYLGPVAHTSPPKPS